MNSNIALTDSSLRQQIFINRGILSMIFEDFFSDNLKFGLNKACPLTPPTPNELTPAMPEF